MIGVIVAEDVSKVLPNSLSSTSASEDSSLSLTDSDRTILGDSRESGELDDASSQRRSVLPQLEPVKYFFKVRFNCLTDAGKSCNHDPFHSFFLLFGSVSNQFWLISFELLFALSLLKLSLLSKF